MELLPDGKKNCVQVSYQDQQNINEFSKLIMRKDMLEQDLVKQKQEKEYLDDVSLEIELIEEDDRIQYKIGDIFVFMNQSDVVVQLEKDMENIDSKIQELEDADAKLNSRIVELKTILHEKFGDNINLER